MNAGWAGFLLFLVFCAAGVVLAAALPQRRSPSILAVCGGLAGLALIGFGIQALVLPRVAPVVPWSIPAIGPVSLQHDPLAGLFLLATGLVALPASLFAAGSIPCLAERYSLRSFAVLYFTLLASVGWILVAADVFSFLVAWEIMSLAAYLLVNFEHETAAHRSAAFLMLGVGEAGALAAGLGLLLLAAHAGTLDFDRIRLAGAGLGQGVRLLAFLFTFFGFGVKAGLVPVNFWLPGAYTAAPAGFAPLLAGATLNLGLYGILRVNADLVPPASLAPGVVALAVGATSALVGILYATTAGDLKTLLAHSSIENAGIIATGFGGGFIFTAAGLPVLAAMAYAVGLYHLVNHSLYKTLLFIGSGAMEQRAGTRDLDRLGGLIRRMPRTAAAVLAGVLSIAALPPFNGFVSEWLALQTLLRSAELPSGGVKIVFALCGAALALTAALAVTCFVKLFAMGFLGVTRSPEAEAATEPGPTALAPMAFLALLCLLLGVLPTWALGGLDRAVRPMTGQSAVAALVPPFFAGAQGHAELPPAFAAEFHDLGAQVGEGVLPGPGLVLLHRGGPANPVVFAAAPAYLAPFLLGALLAAFLLTRGVLARRRRVRQGPCWDGGLRRLLPEMTYTATGFSNPVRVIFHAIFRPTTVEDTRETVAEHFRTAIRREDARVYLSDRLVVRPARRLMLPLARTLARMHHGRLNAYLAYALASLLLVLGLAGLIR
ncbi:MAG: proton-conducting transporter membrane subunit [Gemmatimonadales bacterium]